MGPGSVPDIGLVIMKKKISCMVLTLLELAGQRGSEAFNDHYNLQQ